MSYVLSGRIIYNQDPYSESGMVCELSDPTVPSITHVPVGLSDPAWSLAMANGKRIIEAEDCLRLVQQLGGQDWREWLEAASQAMKEHTVIESYYQEIVTKNRQWYESVINPGSEE